jgi:hypothetical protein
MTYLRGTTGEEEITTIDRERTVKQHEYVNVMIEGVHRDMSLRKQTSLERRFSVDYKRMLNYDLKSRVCTGKM